MTSAYELGYESSTNDKNPYHYRYQRCYFDAWKKGRNDKSPQNPSC